MNKVLKKYGGLILFYVVIIFGIFLLNARFRYLNNHSIVEERKTIEIAFQE